ncbi:MAG: DEAD/DEAH box helicase [Paracoccaceae bacterium]|nr:DEAD/DEAH box helicase [Paracoccaceae bacterium]
MNYFEQLGLSPKLAARVAEAGLTEPTPIQAKAIPLVLEGRDVMGLAQTGTGKTAAFGLPLIHLLNQVGTKPAPKTVRGLILAPTRELAGQIAAALRGFTAGSHMKIGVVVGGMSIRAQAERLARGTDIVIATPGRLIDLLDRGAVTLDQTQHLILDEADQMLDLGFVHALRKIATLLPKDRQTLLFSATMPKLMAELSESYLTNPVRVQVSPPGKPVSRIKQGVHFVAQSEKQALLIQYLSGHRNEQALVFGRTKHGSEKLMKSLVAAGFAAASIHGNKSQGQRDRALASFRSGEIKVLVATDVAARGIDIPGVRHVYNYDLPNVPENYVHRIGRTARAGADGEAVAFCSPAETGELKAVEKAMGTSIPVVGGRLWDAGEQQNAPKPGKGRNRGRSSKPAGKPQSKPAGAAPRRRRRQNRAA